MLENVHIKTDTCFTDHGKASSSVTSNSTRRRVRDMVGLNF